MKPVYGLTLITGGARSGKSSRALCLAEKYSRRAFCATAQSMDEEMSTRIAKHRADRGDDWITIEEPIRLADAISDVADKAEIVVVDCLTVWLGNLFYHLKDQTAVENAVNELLDVLDHPPTDIICVTNEIGSGIVPASVESRSFRDMAGFCNQQVAMRATRVEMSVCGLPLVLKG